MGVGNPNWKPGVSGNPKGRPKKGQTFTDALEDVVTKKELAAKLRELALGTEDRPADVAALKYIYDRIEGKPAQTIESHVYQKENPLADELAKITDGDSGETT